VTGNLVPVDTPRQATGVEELPDGSHSLHERYDVSAWELSVVVECQVASHAWIICGGSPLACIIGGLFAFEVKRHDGFFTSDCDGNDVAILGFAVAPV
jgi:hypothetical protein